MALALYTGVLAPPGRNSEGKKRASEGKKRARPAELPNIGTSYALEDDDEVAYLTGNAMPPSGPGLNIDLPHTWYFDGPMYAPTPHTTNPPYEHLLPNYPVTLSMWNDGPNSNFNTRLGAFWWHEAMDEHGRGSSLPRDYPDSEPPTVSDLVPTPTEGAPGLREQRDLLDDPFLGMDLLTENEREKAKMLRDVVRRRQETIRILNPFTQYDNSDPDREKIDRLIEGDDTREIKYEQGLDHLRSHGLGGGSHRIRGEDLTGMASTVQGAKWFHSTHKYTRIQEAQARMRRYLGGAGVYNDAMLREEALVWDEGRGFYVNRPPSPGANGQDMFTYIRNIARWYRPPDYGE